MANDSIYSFWKLINEFNIEIPIIQRDYAQGRENEKDVSSIRNDIIESIYTSISNNSNLDFDFIYGSVTNDTLCLLDGQQRITTLYLLYWYVSVQEGRLHETKGVLSKFTYETRATSRDFCHLLTQLTELKIDSDTTISQQIRNENKYYSSWDSDPTIKAMLVMLDTIQKKFIDTEDILDLLLDTSEDALLTFHFLKLDDYSLTDDLYIKMNARGLILSDFDNLKAKFIQHLKEMKINSSNFEEKIENQWTDLLWDYRDQDNDTIDEPFLNLFKYFTDMLLLQYSDYQLDVLDVFDIEDIRGMIAFYDSEEKIIDLFELFDLWKTAEEAENDIDEIFCDESDKNKVRLFGSRSNLFESVANDYSISFQNEVLLFSVMKRKIYWKNKGIEDHFLKDFSRIVRNMGLSSRTFKQTECLMQSDYVFARQALSHVKFILKNLVKMENIYSEITNGDLIKNFKYVDSQFLSERKKALIIKKKPQLKEVIFSLEDMDIFKGNINNVLEYISKNENEKLPFILKELFEIDNPYLISTALLSIDDYGIDLGEVLIGRKKYYGNTKDWYHLLTHDKFKNNFEYFLKLYVSSEEKTPKKKLQSIIKEYSKNLEKNDWRYYWIQYYPDLFELGYLGKNNIIYAHQKLKNGFTLIHSLKRHTLGGKHIIPIYALASKKIGKPCHTELSIGANNYCAVNIGKSNNEIAFNNDGEIVIRKVESHKENEKIISKFKQIKNKTEDYIDNMMSVYDVYCNLNK